MKRFLTLILIAVTTKVYSQTFQMPGKAERKILKGLLLKKNINLQAIDSGMLDGFIESIKEDDIDKLWDMVDVDVQKRQSKEDMLQVFNIYGKYYGKMLGYEQIIIWHAR